MAHEPFVPSKWIPLVNTPSVAGKHTGSICSAIRCDAAGTITVTYSDSSTVTFAMVAGELLAGRVFGISIASGTFQGALY